MAAYKLQANAQRRIEQTQLIISILAPLLTSSSHRTTIDALLDEDIPQLGPMLVVARPSNNRRRHIEPLERDRLVGTLIAREVSSLPEQLSVMLLDGPSKPPPPSHRRNITNDERER